MKVDCIYLAYIWSKVGALMTHKVSLCFNVVGIEDAEIPCD